MFLKSLPGILYLTRKGYLSGGGGGGWHGSFCAGVYVLIPPPECAFSNFFLILVKLINMHRISMIIYFSKCKGVLDHLTLKLIANDNMLE